MTVDIDPGTLSSLSSLIEMRGGASRFSDYQLDIALAHVEMMRDVRNSDATPGERAKAAQQAVGLLDLLPPVPAPKREIREVSLDGLSLQQAALQYARAIGDLDPLEPDECAALSIPSGPAAVRPAPTAATRAPAQAEARPYQPDPQDAPRAAAGAPTAPISHDPAPAVVTDRPKVVPIDPRLRVFRHLNPAFNPSLRDGDVA
jgi:hypothetical protein